MILLTGDEHIYGLYLYIFYLLCLFTMFLHSKIWHYRRYVSVGLAGILGGALAFLILDEAIWLGALLIYITILHMVIHARIINEKIAENKCKILSAKNTAGLGSLFLAINGLYLTNQAMTALYLVLSGILIYAIFSVLSKLPKLKVSSQTIDYQDLPSISVLIPSRNESFDLVACLDTLVDVEYDKLEILVLDDCSTNNVNEIIKGFAQKGVRFVTGKEPPKYWLAKNWAYEQLAKEANGDYLVFCGVDTRFERDTISAIAKQLKANNVDMLSILPKRINQKLDTFVLLQSLRYHRMFGSLGLDWLKNAPPISTCFAVKKTSLKKLRRFASCRNSIYPERSIARQVPSYKFLASDINGISITSVKSLSNQYHTAVRTYYPLMHWRLERLALQTILLTSSVAIIIYSTFSILAWQQISVFILIVVLAFVLHGLVIRAASLPRPFVQFFQLPVLIIAEIAIMHISMYKYEFDDVIWKGRNVCIPLLRYEHKLPLEEIS